jgi:hypothetical protein
MYFIGARFLRNPTFGPDIAGTGFPTMFMLNAGMPGPFKAKAGGITLEYHIRANKTSGTKSFGPTKGVNLSSARKVR